jgi:ABC-2 type transport system ATP-binding protein
MNHAGGVAEAPIPAYGRQPGRDIDAALVLDAVTVRRRGVPVPDLDRVSLSVRRGTTVLVGGTAGESLSALVAAVLGLTPLESGTIRVLDLDPADAVATGRVGAVLPGLGLPGGVRVRDLLRLAVRLHDTPLAVEDLAERTGISVYAGARVERLAPSQRLQLQLALALAGDPDLVVLDAPNGPGGTQGWDTNPVIAANLGRFRGEGRTVLITTRQVGVGAIVPDRHLHLDQGALHDLRGAADTLGLAAATPSGRSRSDEPVRRVLP